VALTVYNRAAFAAPPRLVVFDLDNTLYRYEDAHRPAFEAAAAKAQALLGLGREAFRARYETARGAVKGRLDGTAAAHSRLHYFIDIIESAGLGAQPVIALDLEQTYWTAFLAAAELRTHALEFLEDLRLARVPAALVTDLTTQIQLRKLVYWGLDRLFAAVVTSEEAGAEKPAAAPYKRLIEKLGSTPPPIWAIGDTLDRDIAGAKQHLGAATLLFAESLGAMQASPAPDLAFDSFKSLREFFAQTIAAR
jgi:putative hydrolase of the HAD superfamily